MWILFVVGIMVIFLLWCKLPVTGKALAAMFLLLATPFTEYMSFALLVILLILNSIFGKYF
jgi:hypothetical protein